MEKVDSIRIGLFVVRYAVDISDFLINIDVDIDFTLDFRYVLIKHKDYIRFRNQLEENFDSKHFLWYEIYLDTESGKYQIQDVPKISWGGEGKILIKTFKDIVDYDKLYLDFETKEFGDYKTKLNFSVLNEERTFIPLHWRYYLVRVLESSEKLIYEDKF